ncbi:AKL1 [Candida theae]|uniref:AKL1 n=1 Tax=Candida theae TaxID=1198502 RepID=A0AAD5BJ62_9ASCO|nr:AKL1 [Candida theae]KAI5967780.1 AKL1 [Candida theae]
MNIANIPKLQGGTKLQVGKHQVTIVKYISEGGFAHIYEVNINYPENETKTACLKRVIVPDKNGLDQLRKEVEVMKCLRNARSIVSYYDSHAERLDNVNYQVLVLMELCPGGSLLDFMNARIKVKLNEAEILRIMLDVCQGVYEMHRTQLIHRDIKIENVLINKQGSFKLCDFGSTSVPVAPPRDSQQFKLISHDILYHTTPQYRAPEMVDLYRAKPIDEKADIWALGCFLFKLCYYTTPFEANGDIAILHASFSFPPLPQFSGDLKNLIIIMLQENSLYRPNIVQVLVLICKLSNIKFETLGLKDFYNLGPYSFETLQEYQLKKQNEALHEKQLYAQQQRLRDPIEGHNPFLPQVQPEPAPPVEQQKSQPQKQPQPQLQQTVPVPVENAPQAVHGDQLDPKSIERDESNADVLVSPNSLVGFSSEESDEFSELDQLGDAEERYPSLEHLGLEKPTSDSSKVSKGSSGSKHGEAVKENPTNQKSSSVDARDAQPANIETEAEKLADDIFAASGASNSMPEGFSQVHGPELTEAKSGYISDPAGQFSSNARNNTDMATSTTGMDARQMSRPVHFTSTKSANYIKPDTHKNNNPWIGKESNPTPQTATSPSDGHHFTAVSNINTTPWVDPQAVPHKGAKSPNEVRSPTLSAMPQFAHHNTQQPARSDTSHHPLSQREKDLIDLEIGLPSSNTSSSESALNKPIGPSKNNSHLSLIDMDDNDEKRDKQPEQKSQNATSSKLDKPVFKKRISSTSNHAQLHLQEEVIDFASDDENLDNGSDMSRMKIRNSLKKPKGGRRSGELNRSESLQESRKRHSFFGS